MAANSQQRTCIYCGEPVGRVKKGEHIVPDAIGGALAIKDVCQACNNRLSQVDTELCSRSPLSIVASQEIDSHIWQVFDVDHSAQNLLLEARPDWEANSVSQYLQMVFEQAGPLIHGDGDEMVRHGWDKVQIQFTKAMLQAFRRHEAGEKRWLHFERIDATTAIARGYRYPPRIFTPHGIGEIAQRLGAAQRLSFTLRYRTAEDRRCAMNELDNWRSGGRFRKTGMGIGSALPAIGCFFDVGKTLRGLAKIAVNLLCYCCTKTPVDRQHFTNVMRVILGEEPVHPRLFRDCGFVWASDIEPIRSASGGHSFRLTHDGGWNAYLSFFGGRVGAVIRIPGPNHEEWNCVDIHAPINSPEWEFSYGRIIKLLPVHVEWASLSKIIPSVKLFNVQTGVRVRHLPEVELT